MTFEEAREALTKRGQDQVLKYWEDLNGQERESLLRQVGDLDFSVIDLAKDPGGKTIGQVTPLPAMELPEVQKERDENLKAGKAALKAGKAACVLLAGGMGTRLGLDRPKGELNIGTTHDLFLFEQLVKNLLSVDEACGLAPVRSEGGPAVPLYIMTSEKNDRDTREFFRAHDYFGYPKDAVSFFVQEMAPAVDHEGKLLLEGKGKLAESPNGNGGWFSSLVKAGLLKDLKKRGVEWLNIFSVDNPLQKMADPAFLGAVIRSGLNAGGKVVRKNDPHEKMGVVCRIDGRPSIIEYYDLSDEMAGEKTPSGSLTYGFGVILNYFFRVSRLEEILNDRLPVHVVEKKIPFLDEAGVLLHPAAPNGYKFETLVVDMIALMGGLLPYEVVREEEFAPIKNLHGTDSLDSARELMTKQGIRL